MNQYSFSETNCKSKVIVIKIMKENRRIIVEAWLSKHRDLFNTSGLDRSLDIPLGTMQKFFKYNIRLNNKRINKAYRLIKLLGEDFKSLHEEIE